MAVKTDLIKLPFPWFGGKSRAAAEIWQRFGNVNNYVEPFAGGLATLLLRPDFSKNQDFGIETINDLDCYVANFWRAVSQDSEGVANFADWPVNEADLHARHLWLVNQKRFRERMRSDPDFYDVKIAGWWVWGISQWIGGGWCAEGKYGDEESYGEYLSGLDDVNDIGGEIKKTKQQKPHLGNAGMGVHRPSSKRPHLSNNKGIHRPATSNNLFAYMQQLQDRLRSVRVCCGDWSRVLGDSPTTKLGVTAVMLDPPYSHDLRDNALYAIEDDCGKAVRDWAVENGDNPLLRIALCGYSNKDKDFSEHDMPENWEVFNWKTNGGYSFQTNKSNGKSRGMENSELETIWFSPHCLKMERKQQTTIFDLLDDDPDLDSE